MKRAFRPIQIQILNIEYATPVRAAFAEIWDLDSASGGSNGYEAWPVTTRDAFARRPAGLGRSPAPARLAGRGEELNARMS